MIWPYPYLKVYQKKKNYTFKKIPLFSPRLKTTQPPDTWLAFLDWNLDASTNFYNSWVSNELLYTRVGLSGDLKKINWTKGKLNNEVDDIFKYCKNILHVKMDLIYSLPERAHIFMSKPFYFLLFCF